MMPQPGVHVRARAPLRLGLAGATASAVHFTEQGAESWTVPAG